MRRTLDVDVIVEGFRGQELPMTEKDDAPSWTLMDALLRMCGSVLSMSGLTPEEQQTIYEVGRLVGKVRPVVLTAREYDALKKMVDRNRATPPGQPHEVPFFGIELAGMVKRLVDAAPIMPETPATETAQGDQ